MTDDRTTSDSATAGHVPTVSVVIPTYNRPDLLLETLATVFAQTFDDYEVVIVNDGSTDDTLERLERFVGASPCGNRVRVVTQPNGGIGAARNRGVEEARGTYVALLDHDDLWHPEKLAVQVEFMRSRPECVCCCVPWAGTDKPEETVPDWRKIIDGRGIVARPLAALADNNLFMMTSGMMFDRERARGVRFATERQCIEDVPFQVGLMARGPVGIAGDRNLFHYRIHANNYSRQASFFHNGTVMLRRMHRRGELGEFHGPHRRDLARYIASIARVTALRLVLGGYRRKALGLYLTELPQQVRFGRARFLATLPVLALSPPAVLRRLFPDARST